MSLQLKKLLKIGTTINGEFIDQFYDILLKSESEYCIHIDTVISWLDIDKKEFLKNLKNNRKLIVNKDYIIFKNRGTGKGYRKQDIWFNKRAFKIICMYTKSRNGDKVRDYFIQIEDFLERNKYAIIEDMNNELEKSGIRIKQLENNQKPKTTHKTGGYVYIYRTYTYDQKEIFKIGITKSSVDNRINTQNTAHPDNIELIIAFKTSDPNIIEDCLYGILKKYRYRTNRKFFTDINEKQLIKLLEHCYQMSIILEPLIP